MNETPRQRHIRLLKLLAASPKPLHFGPQGDDTPEDIRAVYELLGGGLCEGVPRCDENNAVTEVFNATINFKGRTQLAEWEAPKAPLAQAVEPNTGRIVIHAGKIAAAALAILTLVALALKLLGLRQE